jgi:hypothetical protein
MPSHSLVALAMLPVAVAGPGPVADGHTLAELLACHDRAVGGAALRGVQRIEYTSPSKSPDSAPPASTARVAQARCVST